MIKLKLRLIKWEMEFGMHLKLRYDTRKISVIFERDVNELTVNKSSHPRQDLSEKGQLRGLSADYASC